MPKWIGIKSIECQNKLQGRAIFCMPNFVISMDLKEIFGSFFSSSLNWF